jgi:predicted Zn-dependent peptidase
MAMQFSVKKLKANEVIRAETSNSGMADLMARYAVDGADNPLPYDEAFQQLGELEMSDFYACWMEFLKAGVPNVSGRR